MTPFENEERKEKTIMRPVEQTDNPVKAQEQLDYFVYALRALESLIDGIDPRTRDFDVLMGDIQEVKELIRRAALIRIEAQIKSFDKTS